MATILLIEDEQEIRQIEKDYLLKAGFSILEAEDGEAGISTFKNNAVDLIILDLNLPKLNGIEVCKRIRKDSGVPILMVTARTREIDELLGLEIGADDYVKKPFSPRILVARVKAILQRPSVSENEETISVGDLIIDIPKQKVMKAGNVIALTTVQFNMLTTLAKQPGRVLTRENLINYGYDDHLPPDIYDRTIDSHIKNIRKLIEDDPKDPQYILTVYGKGYAFRDN